MANFIQTWHKSSFGEEDSSLFRWGVRLLFSRRDNDEIAKINWQTLEVFFSRTPVQFSTKLVTQHPWGKGIQVWPRPFLRKYNYEIAKMNWWNSEIFFCRTNGQFHSNLAQIILWCRGFKFVKVKGYTLSLGEIIGEIHWRNLKIYLLNHWVTPFFKER